MIQPVQPQAMPFSRKVYHAIEAIVYVALYHSTMPINGKLLAETQGLPSRYLEQMMQRLVRSGLLRSIRGPRGGYILAKERRRITLGDIVTVLQQGDVEDGVRTHSTPLGEALVLPICAQISHLVYQELQKTTLAQLCDAAYAQQLVNTTPKPQASSHSKRQDFNI
jgi:Rrf2 family transcriptional regulator, iron-sulfur cluster assembly transcription factor